jgi:glycosyltransferase involved in cell wall biosynthesis
VTWSDDPSLDRLRDMGSSVEVRSISGRPQASSRGQIGRVGRQLWQVRQGLRFCFGLAEDEGAHVVHNLFLDAAEIPWLSVRQRPTDSSRAFATLFWPHFVAAPGENVPVARRLYQGVRGWTLGRLLQGPRLAGLFVHSERIKGLLSNLYRSDEVTKKIAVVPDPAPSVEVYPPPDIARKELGLPHEKPIILFFGGFRPSKGPDILLNAMKMLDGDWILVLAGTPSVTEKGELDRLLPRPERVVTRFGFVPDTDVPKYFAAADVVALPYRRSYKGTSGVLQMAAAASTPIVATDVGDVGPTVRSQRLGLVVDPESPGALARALSRFLADRHRISEEVRPRALEYAASTHWRTMARKVRERYESVAR